MATARTDDVYALVPHRSRGYFRSLTGEIRNARPMDPSDKVPGGGLCGSLLDLAAFAAALQGGRLLPTAAIEAMWAPQPLADGTATEYGLGWRVGQSASGRFAFHGGTQPGTSAFLYLERDTATAVVILSNLEQMDYRPLSRRLAALKTGAETRTRGAAARSPAARHRPGTAGRSRAEGRRRGRGRPATSRPPHTPSPMDPPRPAS